MATKDTTESLRALISSALAFRDKSLQARSEWGAITFDKAAGDFKRVFEILAHLSVLPLEYLTDTAVSQMHSCVSSTGQVLGRIDQFNIEQQTPTQVRDNLVAELHSQADQLYHHASPWVPFLAYQKGDVAKNIESLTTSVSQAQKIVEDAKNTIAARQHEIETIITKAREASAAAGAAVFTQDFNNEATKLATRASEWLKLTAWLAGITLLVAIVMWVTPFDATDTPSVIQRFGGKLAILVVLFTATLWCARLHNAFMHQSAVNRHRALSLQTFQAFSQAASDDATKDAVLMEATRAVFGSAPTGFLDGKATGGEGDLKIIEVAKSLGTKSGQ